MATSTRWLLAVAVAAAALVVVSVAVALVVDREADLDLDTPEGAVQAYLRTVADRDAAGALEFYSEDLAARCEARDIRDSLRYGPDDFRASLEAVTPRSGTPPLTEVTVSLTQIYRSGPFDRGESTFREVFVLTETPEGWRFTEPPWPSWCPRAAPVPAATAVPVSAVVPWG
ncbi:MAG: hypothetical protein M0R73_09140 [Dehalococcoidia bacterium]|nr:hypothetical protein [Dehalococcoidia bacterium]